ncbi:serine/arginine-rich splicing factor 11 isoform X4 [Pangasianodon hypophthalmus]|uniref:serine/arginine-rich splicing factor 11 isoform X4 n=1 Tax=Pangasianodon hypophthalmus TaxID=310915 RepID=UPI00230751E8|nr:serine/arginine-rich splicing factor 11 isoform X4 [Pangasianodon hypophthalmus]
MSSGTNVVQVTNVSPSATSEQMRTLFGFLGTVEELKLFPPDDSTMPVTSRVCFVRFNEQESVGVSQHLTNTVFVDRALIVVPYAEGVIPDESKALSLMAPANAVAGLLPGGGLLPTPNPLASMGGGVLGALGGPAMLPGAGMNPQALSADQILKLMTSVDPKMNPMAASMGLKADASNKEIEEAMKRVREAQSLISAAIEPSSKKDSKRKHSRSRSRSRSRRRRSRSRSRHRRSSSRSRRRSRSRSRRRSRSPRRRRSRSRDRGRRSTSKSRRRRRSVSRSPRRSPKRRGSRTPSPRRHKKEKKRDREREKDRERDRDRRAERERSRDESDRSSNKKKKSKDKERERTSDSEKRDVKINSQDFRDGSKQPVTRAENVTRDYDEEEQGYDSEKEREAKDSDDSGSSPARYEDEGDSAKHTPKQAKQNGDDHHEEQDMEVSD